MAPRGSYRYRLEKRRHVTGVGVHFPAKCPYSRSRTVSFRAILHDCLYFLVLPTFECIRTAYHYLLNRFEAKGKGSLRSDSLVILDWYDLLLTGLD